MGFIEEIDCCVWELGETDGEREKGPSLSLLLASPPEGNLGINDAREPHSFKIGLKRSGRGWGLERVPRV
jgi:hypothetical protein